MRESTIEISSRGGTWTGEQKSNLTPVGVSLLKLSFSQIYFKRNFLRASVESTGSDRLKENDEQPNSSMKNYRYVCDNT